MMETLSKVDKSLTGHPVTLHIPLKICMHVRGVVRNDGRVMRAATALRDAGYAVTILDIEDDLTHPSEEEIEGIYVQHIMKPGWLKPVSFAPLRLIRSTRKLIYTTRLLIRIRADAYHAHDDNALTPCFIAASWHRKPLILDAHEFPLIALKDRRWFGVILTHVFMHLVKQCAGVITVSPPIVQKMRELYHVPRVALIRNLPVYRAPEKSDRLRKYLELDSNVRIALYQGNLDSSRGLDKLVRAANFLDHDIVIVMMGKGIGETPTQLRSLIKNEGVHERVKILPPVPYAELLNWTASADIGLNVLPPDYSFNIQMCLPNKLFEYLMAGLPVLASQLPAVAEVINTYDVGRIVPSLKPEEIGMAINALLSDKFALSQMHTNALAAARSDLCWEKESRRLHVFYADILIL